MEFRSSHLFRISYGGTEIYTYIQWYKPILANKLVPFHYQNVVILQPGTSMSVLNAADARPNDIHGLSVSGLEVRNSSNSFALRWRIFSSEVEKLKWFCFDFASKLALYTLKSLKKLKKRTKSSHNTVCVTYKAK